MATDVVVVVVVVVVVDGEWQQEEAEACCIVRHRWGFRYCIVVDFSKEDPSVLDEGISRREISREVMLAYDSVSTTLALPLKNGSVFEWSVAAPSLILPYLCEASEAFRRIMATVERRYSLILYVDEFTPGDPLHPETCRKTAGFYIAIKEFGCGHQRRSASAMRNPASQ